MIMIFVIFILRGKLPTEEGIRNSNSRLEDLIKRFDILEKIYVLLQNNPIYNYFHFTRFLFACFDCLLCVSSPFGVIFWFITCFLRLF